MSVITYLNGGDSAKASAAVCHTIPSINSFQIIRHFPHEYLQDVDVCEYIHAASRRASSMHEARKIFIATLLCRFI